MRAANYYICVLLLASCGSLAEPNVVLSGPIIGIGANGAVILQGVAKNIGTATAENCVMDLDVISMDTKAVVESHTKYLGDIRPGDGVNFEVALTVAKWGDAIEYRTGFSWD